MTRTEDSGGIIRLIEIYSLRAAVRVAQLV
jgi:hypothetical protein